MGHKVWSKCFSKILKGKTQNTPSDVKNLFKGSMTQNIFFLKSGPKSCKDLKNDNDLQK